VELVPEECLTQSLLDLSLTGVGCLPAVEADCAHDLVDIINDAFHHHWRIAGPCLLKQRSQSRLAAVDVLFLGCFALRPDDTAPVAAPVILCELDFASGAFLAWTGLGPLHWAGKVFEGVGDIGAVGEIEETIELRAVRLTLALSPVPQEVVDIALAERSFRLRPARLWGALLDAEGAFVADPFPLWAGLMDTMEVVDGAEPRASLLDSTTAWRIG